TVCFIEQMMKPVSHEQSGDGMMIPFHFAGKYFTDHRPDRAVAGFAGEVDLLVFLHEPIPKKSYLTAFAASIDALECDEQFLDLIIFIHVVNINSLPGIGHIPSDFKIIMWLIDRRIINTECTLF